MSVRKYARKATKFGEIGSFAVTKLIVKTSWRAESHSNSLYRSFSSNNLHVSANFGADSPFNFKLGFRFGTLSESIGSFHMPTSGPE